MTQLPDGLEGFHPAVAAWFAERFPDGPTDPQLAAWPAIRSGADVLVAAPTGSGKTLTGFLVAIDAAFRAADEGEEESGGIDVLYLSPLRALATDVAENLEIPLKGITEAAERLGLAPAELSVAVRTGDTSSSERAAMRRRPPRLLCTTPESLFVLLTSASGRRMLSSVRTVIVDEIHALARDKRGSHLAVSLERLDRLVATSGGALQRIGLSATQKPLEAVARLLGGTAPGREPPVIVDAVRPRQLDIELVLPDDELEAVASHRQMDQVLDAIARIVLEHRTTLVFVNTRRMAERVAHLLAERLSGPDYGLDDAELVVAAHHGSLSAERRRRVEARLRAGELRALVATASLELGIDVGPVEMVCQLGSPRSISTFLQRVGRANHSVGGVPSGRLFALTRDEAVECAALLQAVSEGELDLLVPPVAPLDIAVQQLVAEVAALEEATVDDMAQLLRSSAPFEALSDEDLADVLELASRGIATGRGRRGAHLHHDAVNGRLRARPGARLSALTGGGAIPETGDYRVVLEPDGVTLGAVNEDFAIESTAGDVFILGTHSWRVAKVETGVVRVVDAAGAAPTIPFWIGEAPARTAELSSAVGRLRGAVEAALISGGIPAATAAVEGIQGVGHEAAEQVAAYLAAAREALGCLPTGERLVVERFFDDVDSTQLVVHSPLGGRINRALGLALRKRFCVTFDFELQAAADDDAVTIALGPHHSFPLAEVPKLVSASNVADVLTQAVLPHPMLASRWRWNLGRSLVVSRSMGGRRKPIHLQRMEAEDLLAAAWPSLAACQENAGAGPIPVPDHVLVRQTLADVMVEPLDLEGVTGLLERIASGVVEMAFVESAEPSPLALGILNGRPYTFLDDAPLEERRSRAVPQRRSTGSFAEAPLPSTPLEAEAVEAVLATVAPRVRNADELHDLLLDAVSLRPVPEWEAFASELRAERRLVTVDGFWSPAERTEEAEQLGLDDDAAADCLGAHLERSGPISLAALIQDEPLPCGTLRGAPLGARRAETAVRRLEGRGMAIELPDGRWCARHLLARLHAASRGTRRRRIEAVPVATYLEMVARLGHVAEGSRLEGRAGLLELIGQLGGIELAAGEWERSVLPARLASYDPRWLDELCLSGEVAWGRLSIRSGDAPARPAPSKATPMALVLRDDLGLWLEALRRDERPSPPEHGAAAEVFEALAEKGATFRSDLPGLTGRLPSEVDEALLELSGRGLVTADSFSALRALISPASRMARRQRPIGARPWSRGLAGSGSGEGRWALLDPEPPVPLDRVEREELAEEVARRLARRWGVVMIELASREPLRIPWRELSQALRRLEARGELLGGRFVSGLSGEQFATPEAVELMGRLRHEDPADAVVLSAADPLNLSGVLLPGPRIPAQRHRSVRLGSGEVLDAG